MALKQSLQQKLLQKLSPQQIQLMKMLQLPTIALEARIKEEEALSLRRETQRLLDVKKAAMRLKKGREKPEKELPVVKTVRSGSLSADGAMVDRLKAMAEEKARKQEMEEKERLKKKVCMLV